MATVHKGYRLDTELVAQIAAWAEGHKTTEAEAVRTLLAQALAADSQEAKEAPQADADTLAMLGDHIKDLRANVSTLTAQLAEKDAQIHRLADLADHAQALQAAQAKTQLLEAAGTVDVAQGVEQQGTKRASWRARLARWIAGGEE